MSKFKNDNLKNWVLTEAEGEAVEGIVIGEMGWGDYLSEDIPNYEDIPKGKLLTWDEGSKLIDYDFDSGYGAPGCQAIYVWTESKVMFISQYDGATCIHSIPRNPCDVKPEMPGG